MIGKAEEIMSWLWHQDRDKTFEIKEKRKKRSLSQNSYAWELIGQISDLVRKSKEEVYMDMLRHYGQSELVTIKSEINPIGYFKYFETYKVGDKFTAYRIFKGSSEYDSREMTIFIDGIIQEAENLGIHTLSDEQVKGMKLI